MHAVHFLGQGQSYLSDQRVSYIIHVTEKEGKGEGNMRISPQMKYGRTRHIPAFEFVTIILKARQESSGDANIALVQICLDVAVCEWSCSESFWQNGGHFVKKNQNQANLFGPYPGDAKSSWRPLTNTRTYLRHKKLLCVKAVEIYGRLSRSTGLLTGGPTKV